MWEGTTLRVMVADRHYGEFYDFYSISPEYFGYTLTLSCYLHIGLEPNPLCSLCMVITLLYPILVKSLPQY
jgi:hypothetical protein